jgi:phytoene synthase
MVFLFVGGSGFGVDSEIKEIFREGSTSYYYSSLFFPEEIKKDVFRLYAYVRTADDFVDDLPQQEDEFQRFRAETLENWNSSSEDKIVDLFLQTCQKHDFKKEWVEAFLDSMEMDLYKSEYATMDETLEYIHGSAEVIGLMMVKLLDVPEEAYRPAKLMGRSMQYCNFIRDVKEDNELGRQYLPTQEMHEHGLESLEEDKIDEEDFREFLRDQIDHYNEWRVQGEEGLRYIPYRTRVPVRLSSNLYRWTSEVIQKDPMVVYERQVRPSRRRIALELLKASKP